uniref:Uncharacterized protein n=1 Tax=Cacopsylla melanoneura TaxID=428564 RepID=A0A8D8QPG8_9HEMI
MVINHDTRHKRHDLLSYEFTIHSYFFHCSFLFAKYREKIKNDDRKHDNIPTLRPRLRSLADLGFRTRSKISPYGGYVRLFDFFFEFFIGPTEHTQKECSLGPIPVP